MVIRTFLGLLSGGVPTPAPRQAAESNRAPRAPDMWMSHLNPRRNAAAAGANVAVVAYPGYNARQTWSNRGLTAEEIPWRRADLPSENIVEITRHNLALGRQLLVELQNAVAPAQSEITAPTGQTSGRQLREAVEVALQSYWDLRALGDEHERARSMQRQLPHMAHALQQPGRYLDGPGAQPHVEQATNALHDARAGRLGILVAVHDVFAHKWDGADAHARAGVAGLGDAIEAARADNERFARDGGRVADLLEPSNVARELTGGRAATLEPEPLPAEVQAWNERAAALKAAAGGFRELEEGLAELQPQLRHRAEAAQAVAMGSLRRHFHVLGGGCPEAQTAVAVISDRLIEKARLADDKPLALLQMAHIGNMVRTVAQGHPGREAALLQTVAAGDVVGAMRNHALQLDNGHAQGLADIASLWQLAANRQPEMVTSLMAVRESGHGAESGPDYRDVMRFWRCAEEHAALGDSAEEAAHRARLAHAMKGLSSEDVCAGRPLPANSPHKAGVALARTNIAKLEHFQEANRCLRQLVDVSQNSPLMKAVQVRRAHTLFERKGNGHPAETARLAVESDLESLRLVADNVVDLRGAEPASVATACLLQALTQRLTAPWRHAVDAASKTDILADYRQRLDTNGVTDAGAHLAEFIALLENQDDRHDVVHLIGLAVAATRGREGFEALTRSAGSQAQPTASTSGPVVRSSSSTRLEIEPAGPSTRNSAELPAAGSREIAAIDIERTRHLVDVAKAGSLNTRRAVQGYLHDAIDRTELGDRMDLASARQAKVSVPIRYGWSNVRLGGTPHGHAAAGSILYVQANNDALQLTVGSIQEFSAGLLVDVRGYGKPHPSVALGGGGGGNLDYTRRDDTATVLRYWIKPENGLRDLTQAREQMKRAVDVLTTWDQTNEAHGEPYGSPLEAMLDQLEVPPQIDIEQRHYRNAALEGQARFAASVNNVPEPDSGEGFVALGRAATERPVMHSENHLGAFEVYDTKLSSAGAEVSGSVGGKVPWGSGAVYTSMRGTAAISASVMLKGDEQKIKRPVGTDLYQAYKHEFGLYHRDPEQFTRLLEQALPQVARRVHAVCKGVSGLSDTELSRLEYELVANFRRVIVQGKADRFSTKLESGHQWLNRGLDAGIRAARSAHDHLLASTLENLRDGMLQGNADQALKYFVAAEESLMKHEALLDVFHPIQSFFARSDLKSTSENPVLPDTRTDQIALHTWKAKETVHPSDMRRQAADMAIAASRSGQTPARGGHEVDTQPPGGGPSAPRRGDE